MAKFENASMPNTVFSDVDLENARFRAVAMANGLFEDIGLAGARFHNADMRNTRFENVSLQNASITDANLAGMTINGHLVTDLLALASGGGKDTSRSGNLSGSD
nr:pentapeptide repeat-containing protein [uncultured Gellertiella sp.]